MMPSGLIAATGGQVTFRNSLVLQMLGSTPQSGDSEGWICALRPEHRTLGKWKDAEPVGYDPKLRLEMMDAHGVQASVIFPSQGLIVSQIKPPEISAGICRDATRGA